MLTPAEIKRFRVEHAADLERMKKRGTLVGATDEVTPGLADRIARASRLAGHYMIPETAKKIARHVAALDEPPLQKQMSAAVNERAEAREGVAVDNELVEFLRGRLSDEDLAAALEMLGLAEGDETDDETGERELERMGASYPAEDDPPPFPGRPRPGGAMDSRDVSRVNVLVGFDAAPSEANARRKADARRVAGLQARQQKMLRDAKRARIAADARREPAAADAAALQRARTIGAAPGSRGLLSTFNADRIGVA